MTDQQGVIRRIAWRDLFPWLILLRTFRIAIAPAGLAVATLAVLVAPLGWGLADWIFRPPPRLAYTGTPLAEIREDALAALGTLEGGRTPPRSRASWRSRIPRSENSTLFGQMPLAVTAYIPAARTALFEAYFDLAEPLARFFQLKMTVNETAYYAFGILWTLAVWAFPGGLITRRAVVQLATESPPGLRPTAAFACRRYHWYFLAPLYPLLGLLLLAVPIALVGLPIRVAIGLGSILAGLVWILVAIAGLGAMWLLGGLIFGWPLMWPTISAERDGDAFEAFSRSYSYVYGKPLHYFFYVVVAAAFGALCWAVVSSAMLLVQEFGFWALAWGGGGEAVTTIHGQALDFAAGRGVPQTSNSALKIGATLIGLVVALVQSAAIAFRYSYFFSAASAIYLLLRHDVDEKEMDEIDAADEVASAVPSTAPAAAPSAPTPATAS